MHEQEGMIQLSYSAKCPYLDILLRQITESYLPAHASPSKLAWSRCKLYGAQLHMSLDIDDKLVQSTVFLCVVCCVWLRGLSYIMCFSFSSRNNAWHMHSLKTLTGQAQLEDTYWPGRAWRHLLARHSLKTLTGQAQLEDTYWPGTAQQVTAVSRWYYWEICLPSLGAVCHNTQWSCLRRVGYKRLVWLTDDFREFTVVL